jgi:hypothetical protein
MEYRRFSEAQTAFLSLWPLGCAYEIQRATVMAILSENRKKEYPKSVTELLKLEEKRFVQGVSYFINKIPIFILKNQLDT